MFSRNSRQRLNRADIGFFLRPRSFIDKGGGRGFVIASRNQSSAQLLQHSRTQIDRHGRSVRRQTFYTLFFRHVGFSRHPRDDQGLGDTRQGIFQI